MRFQSLKDVSDKSENLNRKERRKALGKQKKLNKALHCAKTKKFNNISFNAKDFRKILILNQNNPNIYSGVEDKILVTNPNKSLNGVSNKKKKKKKSKKSLSTNGKDTRNTVTSDEPSSSFKISNNQNLRMAKLEEYVRRESSKNNATAKKTKMKKQSNGEGNSATCKLIKDEGHLQDILNGQRHDDKEINNLEKSLRLNAYQKKGLPPEFAVEFGDILEDINSGLDADVEKYKDLNYGNDLDTRIERDMSIALGRKETSHKKENSSDSESDFDMESSNELEDNREISDQEMRDNIDENYNKIKCTLEKEKNEVESDDEEDDLEDGSERNQWLDDLAEESDCKEESEDGFLQDDEDELRFEGGSRSLGNASSSGTSNSRISIDNIFNLYSSSSEDDSTDLDGFIVDDNYVEYEKNASSPAKKLKKSRIIGRERKSSLTLSDDSEKENVTVKKPRRKRLLSDESDEGEEEANIELLNNNEQPQEHTKKKIKKNPDSNGLFSNSPLKSNDKTESSINIGSKESDLVELGNSSVCNLSAALSEPTKKKHKKKKKSPEPFKENPLMTNIKLLEGKLENNKYPQDHTKKKIKKEPDSDGLFNGFPEKSNDEAKSLINIGNKESDLVELGDGSVCNLSTALSEHTKKKPKNKKKNNKIGKENVSISNNKIKNHVQEENEHMVNSIMKKSNKENDSNQKSKAKVSFQLPEEEELDNDGTGANDYHEDIYGRLRDKYGKIISNEDSNISNKYIPPAVRKLTKLNNSAKKKEQLEALKRKLKGLLNRLTVNNLAGILSQIEGLYITNSTNDMNDVLSKLLLEIVMIPVLIPTRLLEEHALLVAILSSNIGPEVGAQILTEFVIRWDEELQAVQPTLDENEISSKEVDNVLHFLSQLYNFKVFDSTLIYDILHKVLERPFGPKEVDLILLVLRSVGFSLRKDDPLGLKQLISAVHSRVGGASAQHSEEGFSRIKFMLEILTAIKNNNMGKVPNYDPTHCNHLKSLMKGLVKKGSRAANLKIPLEDVLRSKVAGKWWLVGSAWCGVQKEQVQSIDISGSDKEVEKSINPYSEAFMKKAEKLHMSRPPRIHILYAITEGSQDYEEAVENLFSLKLPTNKEKEIFNICIYCLVRCKEYNVFYSHLCLKLVRCRKNYKRLLQFSIWDSFKELDKMKLNRIANLAKFVAFLVVEDVLNLGSFKKLNFIEAGENTVSFLRQVLIAILLNPTGTFAVTRAFDHLLVPKFKVLRQYIRIFIIKFISPKKAEDKEMQILKNRVEKVVDDLSSVGGVTL